MKDKLTFNLSKWYRYNWNYNQLTMYEKMIKEHIPKTQKELDDLIDWINNYEKRKEEELNNIPQIV